MSIWNALRGLISDLIDRLAERVARSDETRANINAHISSPEPGYGREVIARMARSEVKNYLAALAEAAGVPFTDPDQLIANLHEGAVRTAATTFGFITMTPEEFHNLAGEAHGTSD